MLTIPSPGKSLCPLALFPQIMMATIIVLITSLARAEPVIGLSLPLSGGPTSLARQFRYGADLALERHNRNADVPVSMILVDDGCNEELALLAAEDLAEANATLVTGLLCNASAKAMADRFVGTGIPVLVAGARSPRLIKDREREEWNLFRLSPGDQDAAEFAAQTLGDLWQGKAYAVIDDGTVYGRNAADAFRSTMEDRGLPPQFQDNFRPTQSTQARVVRRLSRAGITHVFIGASAEDVAMISRNAAEIGIPLQIAGGEVMSVLPYLPPDQSPPEGLLAVALKADISPALPPALVTRLKQESIQPELNVLVGYQAIEVALQAVTDQNANPETVLRQDRFDTILGEVSFAADGSNNATQYELYHWNGQSFVLYPK